MSLWEEASKRSSKNKPGECASIWADMTPNGALKFGSLVHWAKEGNLELYEKLKPSLTNSIREVFKDDRK